MIQMAIPIGFQALFKQNEELGTHNDHAISYLPEFNTSLNIMCSLILKD